MAIHKKLKQAIGKGLLPGLAVALFATLLAGSSTAQVARAQSLVVTTTDDTNDGVCDSNCSLREAIGAALDGDEVIVPEGVYTVSPELVIDVGLKLMGAGADLTIIQADAVANMAGHAVFMVTGGGVTISDVTVRHGGGLVGGGIAIEGAGASLTLVNAIVSNNSGAGGGGIANSGALSIIGSVVRNNTASVGAGIFSSSVLNVSDSIIEGNQGDVGGGIFLDFGVAEVVNSTLSGNQATDGGAVFVQFGTLNVVNSTISGNAATASGGGFFNAMDGNVNLSNVTVAANAADSDADGIGDGGGVFNAAGGAVSLKNTIVARNADPGGAPDCAGALASLGFNLVQNASGCALSGGSDDIVGSDPLLGQLQDNGGATTTHTLMAGSVAIDAGDPAGCADHMGASLTTDQRGEPRPTDGDGSGSARCDIGAYEAAANAPLPVPGNEPPQGVVVVLTSAKDSFVKADGHSLNAGASPMLVVRHFGRSRALVAFDLSRISTQKLKKATLVLTIQDASELFRWQEDARYIDVHRLTEDWTEGNGGGSRYIRHDANRGRGPGVTWHCATDAQIANLRPDCNQSWKGGQRAMAAKTTPGAPVTEGAMGELSWDVTQDVMQGAQFGWLIKKAKERSSGSVSFYSKEGAAAAGNPGLAPRLVLEFGP